MVLVIFGFQDAGACSGIGMWAVVWLLAKNAVAIALQGWRIGQLILDLLSDRVNL